MKARPVPLRRLLRGGLGDVATARMWREIERRRDATMLRASASSRLRRARRWAWLVATAIVVGGLAAVVLVDRLRSGAPGPLASATGAGLEALASASSEARTVVLTDGSIVTLAPGARLDVLDNDGRVLVARLAGGTAHFDVQPHGPRRWTVEAGLLSVEVVGTRFAVRREAGEVEVDVEHGVVLVRSERVRDHIVRLVDGQHVVVTSAAPAGNPADGRPASPTDAPPASAAERPSASVAATGVGQREVPPDSAQQTPVAATATSRTAAEPDWLALAHAGDYSASYELLGRDGIRRVTEADSVRDLLTAADVARLSGHPDDAVAPLRRIVFDHSGDPAAAVAAFTLGRVELDALSEPANAADAFARALVLGLPSGLAEDAYVRLVESRARAGDAPGARRAAGEYRERFPRGQRASDVARWAGGP